MINFTFNILIIYLLIFNINFSQMFILILLGLINSQDICNEYLSYESCIKNTHTTCLWDEDRESCFILLTICLDVPHI